MVLEGVHWFGDVASASVTVAAGCGGGGGACSFAQGLPGSAFHHGNGTNAGLAQTVNEVMADLSGKPAEPLSPVAERKFLEVDVDNFDDRLKSMKPRVAFQVPNTLTGEGNLSIDMTFESMEDFPPAAVASKVEALNKLLQARTQLSNLMGYMDGKTGAEQLIARALQDPALLQEV